MSEKPDLSDAVLDESIADRLVNLVWRVDDFRQRPWFVASVAVCCGLGIGLSLWLGRSGEVLPIEESIPHIALVTTIPSTVPDPPLIVHVAGEVIRPGVYELRASGRVVDAVAAAGGALEGSGVHQLNLALPLVDGMQIWVPKDGEPLRPLGPAESATSTGPIDLNSATAEQLESLPGVGPATASAIINYRDDNGPFTLVEDLLGVPGIGPAKLAMIFDEAIAR